MQHKVLIDTGKKVVGKVKLILGIQKLLCDKKIKIIF